MTAVFLLVSAIVTMVSNEGDRLGFSCIRVLIGIALATIALGPSAAQAHEIGTTQVHALFRKDHTYSIDVITAPQALVNKVETQRHQPRSSALTPQQLQE